MVRTRSIIYVPAGVRNGSTHMHMPEVDADDAPLGGLRGRMPNAGPFRRPD